MLMDKRLDSLEILATDNCLMMIRNHILIFFTVVVVPVESRIGEGLLENTVTYIFFIREHSANRSRCPFTVSLGRDATQIQICGNAACTFS